MTEANILVCVDGSDYTEPSLLHAAWLGERVGASRLIVSHIADVGKYQVPFVNELGAGIGLQPCNGLFCEIHKQEQDSLKSLEQRIADTLGNTAWAEKYEWVVTRGRPEEALGSLGIRYTHVVFGKRGDSFSYDQEHLGSNLGKFLKHSAVPCLLSSRKYQPIQRIALVFAEDQDWRSVVEFVKNTSDVRDLELQLVHTFGDSIPNLLQELYQGLVSVNAKTSLHDLRNVQDDSVIGKVKELDADLLVVGAHRESHFFQWLGSPLGKTVIRECRIPILLSRSS